jgi:hypothetical protein
MLAQVVAKAREVADARGAKLRAGRGTRYDVVLVSQTRWMSCNAYDRAGERVRIHVAQATAGEMNAMQSEFAAAAGTSLGDA